MTNSLIAPSGFLIKEVQRGESTTNVDTLFEGSKETLESIWRASAVQDKEGNFHGVLNNNHVQEVNGAFRVRLHSGLFPCSIGTFLVVGHQSLALPSRSLRGRRGGRGGSTLALCVCAGRQAGTLWLVPTRVLGIQACALTL